MWKRILDFYKYKLLSFFKPEIIGNPRRFIKNTGMNVGISNTTHISNNGNNLKIGNNVFIGHFNYIDAFNETIEIGDNVQITNYTNILTHSTHNSIRFYLNHLSSEEIKEINNVSPVKIGRNSYIGPHTVIMPGTIIGENVIIGAYSFVKGEIADNSIVRGIPAKTIGSTQKIDAILLGKFQLKKK
jgi:acetyltransferase-like isoleucine patch superfamily enzyme